ncbi:membrane dipeptidase-domain-containing protein [Annulohypoxylon moriforme]|nr:membrane dipeptidase-domain-containing protein [Annulohypoxylon moriforme]
MAEPQSTPENISLPNDEQNASTEPQGPNSPERSLIVHNQVQNYGFFSRFRYHVFAAGFAFLLSPFAFLWPSQSPVDPTDYAERTRRVLKTTPLIDGHNDLPWQLRIELHNRIYDGELDLTKKLLGHTDLRRMREGMVGGQFWSVYTECDFRQQNFEDPTWAVRETLEQIDVTRRFIDEHPVHLQYCDTAACAQQAFKSGRIASMIGIEGSHQLGGSIASIRQMYNLGARYITLTHNCDTSWGTSAYTIATGQGPDGGLFKLGYEAIKEMNRLGMMVDLSHVSHQTMRDVLSVARAPVIFSHSGAYSVTQHVRNVPDDVLRTVKRNGGIVMAVFVNRFINKNPDQATIHDVVDHIFHIAEVCGWDCVGVGSDFSGTRFIPAGLEDVSKYPDLIQLLMERGATDEQVRLLAGDNILRIWSNIEQAAREIQAMGEKPVEEEYEGRVWNKGLRDSPWMLRGSREKAIMAGTADKPHTGRYEWEPKHSPGSRP